MLRHQKAGDGAKKSDGTGNVLTPRKLLMGTYWAGQSGMQPSMSDFDGLVNGMDEVTEAFLLYPSGYNW